MLPFGPNRPEVSRSIFWMQNLSAVSEYPAIVNKIPNVNRISVVVPEDVNKSLHFFDGDIDDTVSAIGMWP